ncbi:MAG TPA: prepilin-type N-terminal cleavage/methylation domain-containing protein [Mycobacteriales bacterium]|nr:prepilin-type N-terminal cleavage/methylation domain-containing protein [Mycobacteriales bacterium]
MLARLRKTQEEREGGFTLIELLVVVIIIGILAAIAIPTFLGQREKAWERAAASDLRNAATTVEDHFSNAGTYVGATGWKQSDKVTVTLPTSSTTGYCLTAVHSSLTGRSFVLKSTEGKVQEVGVNGATACA